jgi:dimethylargininase
MKFKRAIVRTPCPNLVKGFTTVNLGVPHYQLALQQHANYISALKNCGLNVIVLPAENEFPDSTFIEDVALLTPYCAIVTNPGAPSRKGESKNITEFLSQFFNKIEYIKEPGTLDAGDVLQVGQHFYIGLSKRTNMPGARQMQEILENYGFTSSFINVSSMLHLKSGVAYLENGNLVISEMMATIPEFQKYSLIKISSEESYAANCVWINGKVIIPKKYPNAKQLIENANYQTIEVDLSEFRKVDGGVSCLSLRF